MNELKPRLFFFGDSFVQWEKPIKNHWTERFEEEYEVYRLGCSGASNQGICSQIALLPPYREGDRLVVVLTEPTRLPLWMHTDEDGNFDGNSYSNKIIKKNLNEFLKYFMFRMSELLNFFKNSNKFLTMENPIQLYNLFGFLYKNLKKYKPIYVTWSDELIKLKLLGDLLYLIPKESYTTISQEEKNSINDNHPGVEGGKVWYNQVKYLMDNYEYKNFTPKPIGTPYEFKKGFYKYTI